MLQRWRQLWQWWTKPARRRVSTRSPVWPMASRAHASRWAARAGSKTDSWAARLVDVDIEQALELRPREILGPAFRRLVKIDDRFGHSRDLGRGQLARARQTVEQRFLIKASHLDQPIDHRALTIAHALAIDRQRAVGSASHRHRTTIEARRGAPVDANFGLACSVPSRHARVVHVLEVHRAFELIGPLADQEHDRAVCIDPLDCRSAVAFRRREEGDRFALILDDHAGIRISRRSGALRPDRPGPGG